MTGKARDAEFRHPEAVAYLESLTDEEAAKHPPLVREHDGVATRQRREGGRVRCREVAAEASVGSSSEMEAVHAAAAEFGRSLPQLKAELRAGGVPDLDALETRVRAGMLSCGAKGYAALLEMFDADLPTPSCPSCGRPMERHGRIGKTFKTRLGPARVERIYCRCRACGCGHFPFVNAKVKFPRIAKVKFPSNCISRLSNSGWNRGGSGLLRVCAGFASSRLRRVQFVRFQC